MSIHSSLFPPQIWQYPQHQENSQPSGYNSKRPPSISNRLSSLIYPQLLQKTGQIDRTVDREFADEEAKYRMYDIFLTSAQLPIRPTRPHPSVSRKNARYYRRIAKLTGMRWEVSSSSNSACFSPLNPVLVLYSHDFFASTNSRDAGNVLRCCGSIIWRCHGRPRLQAIRGRPRFKLREGTGMPRLFYSFYVLFTSPCSSGWSLSNDHLRTSRQDVCLFPCRKWTHHKAQ